MNSNIQESKFEALKLKYFLLDHQKKTVFENWNAAISFTIYAKTFNRAAVASMSTIPRR
jgi:hypothetical protein